MPLCVGPRRLSGRSGTRSQSIFSRFGFIEEGAHQNVAISKHIFSKLNRNFINKIGMTFKVAQHVRPHHGQQAR